MPLCPRLPAVAIIVFALACGKQDHSVATADSASTQAATATATAAATAAPTPKIDTITVIARDFTFEAPSAIPAGVTTFRLVNQGKELHHAQVFKFEQGKTLNDFMTALKSAGPLPAWAIAVGGPDAPAPGAEANATLPLEPGNYALVCFIDTPDHVPHVMKGMSHPFTVIPATTSKVVAEPTADVTVTLSDYAFTLSKPLTPGTHTIRVENIAAQTHEIEILQLDSGKTMDDVLRWTKSYKGALPARPIGGMAGISKGRHGFFTVNLPAGEYGLICFYPDMKDGKPHFMHGMRQQIKIS